jgi:diacylglycerol kinase (ATP)
VGYGDVEVLFADADHIGEALDLVARDPDGRGAPAQAHHLDAVPLDQAAPERLGYRLFCGPASCVVAFGEAVLLAVGDLRLRKEALPYFRRPLERELHPLDVYDIDPDTRYDESFHGAYVTARMGPRQKGYSNSMDAATDAVIIGNPNSGRAGDEGYLERFAKMLRSEGLSVEALNTEHPNHATELATLAGDRLVVAAGGDGTVNEVLNGLSPGATLGILPLGTANVLARELGIPLDAEGACRRILEGEVSQVDYGVATDGRGVERRFACMAGIGFDAKVVSTVTPRLKRILRGLAFAVTAFRVLFGNKFPNVEIASGDEVHVARFAIVANGHYYGGDYRVTGPGLLTSGELETVLVERVSILLRPDVFAWIIARRPLNRAMQSFTSTEVSASAPGAEVPVQLDGELWGELPMSFRIEPAALKVVR